MATVKRTFLLGLIAFFILVMILPDLFFPRGAPRVFMNQRRAVRSVTNISLAERNYVARHPDAGYVCSLKDLGEQDSESLPEVRLVDQVLASGTRDGYHFEVKCSQDGGQKSTGYTITAVPITVGATGEYALCTDQSGEIWYAKNGLASDCLALHKPIERKYR